MKKTLSMLLAVIIAALAICTMAVTVFADNDDPTDPLAKTSTTAAATTAASTTAAPTTTAAATTAAPTTTKAAVSQTAKISDEIVTNAPGATAIDDGPATTKKAAAVVDSNPSTGSNIVVPVIAFLALTAGVAAVVKTKKEEE